MSLLDLKRGKELKEVGRALGREGIAIRALEIAKEIIKDGSYKGAVKGMGQMLALGQCCNFDSYWTEKREMGKNSEYERLTALTNFEIQRLISKQTHLKEPK
jgi:hypothetical protein